MDAIKNVYVSLTGSEADGCGLTAVTPCNTLTAALTVTAPGDTIFMDATGTDQQPYIHCAATPIVFPMTIIGLNGKAHMACPANLVSDSYQAFIFRLIGTATHQLSIYLKDLYFNSGKIFGYDVDLTVENCIFNNSTMYLISPTFFLVPDFYYFLKSLDIAMMSYEYVKMINQVTPAVAACNSVNLTFINNTFLHKEALGDKMLANILNLELDINIICQNVTANILNSNLAHRKLQIMSNKIMDVFIDHSVFEGLRENEIKMGGIAVLAYATNAKVIIQNSAILRHTPSDPLPKLSYRSQMVRGAPIYVWFIPPLANLNGSSEVMLNNVRCEHNTGAVSILGMHYLATIINCQFLNNWAPFEAAALFLFTDPGSKIIIENNIFVNNTSGGNLRDQSSKFQDIKWGSQMCVYKLTVINNALDISMGMTTPAFHGIFFNGTLTSQIKGTAGAILIKAGNMTVRNCSFIGNIATRYGGSIKSSRDAFVKIEDCYFENSATKHMVEDGEVIYSEGALELVNVKIKINVARSNASIIRHSGTEDNLFIKSMYIECPINYHLTHANSSDNPYKFPVLGISKYRSAVYFCTECFNSYINDFGFINITFAEVMFKSGDLTLSQMYEYSVSKEHICHKCPYGAKCKEKLTAKIDFWGVEKGKEVDFYRCPKTYCCISENCSTFNECSGNRTGILCGDCVDGYSEALFSSKCIPNITCKDAWLLSLTLVVGALYAIFLLTQNDLKDQIINGPLGVESFIHMKNQMVGLIRKKKEIKKATESQEFEQKEKQQEQVQDDILITDLDDEIDDIPTLDKDRPRRKSEWSDTTQSSDQPEDNNEKVENVVQMKTQHSNTKFMSPGGGFLVQIFYYFQDATLLHIETSYVVTDSSLASQIKTIVGGLFKFRLEIFYLANESCPFAGLDASLKLIFKVLFLPFVLALLSGIYAFSKSSLFLKIRGKTKEELSVASYTFISRRASTGLMLALMFSFQKLAMTTLALLNCVSVADKKVLFMQGSVECYTFWQWIVIIYFIICIVPFPIHLALGPALLRHGIISLPEYLLACLFPLPFIITWMVRAPRQHKKNKEKTCVLITPEAQAVCGLVQGPFRVFHLPGIFQSLCWSGMLLGRRLMLIICYTFIEEELTRLLVMFFICTAVLLQHMHVLPYKNSRGNISGTLSAAALLIVCIVNLVRAAFDSAEYLPDGPNEALMYAFDHIENAVLLWIPLAGLGVILLVIVIRLLWLIVEVTFLRDSNKVEPEEQEKKTP